MSSKALIVILTMALFALLVGGCYPDPSPPNLTPIPTLAPGPTLAPIVAVAGSPTSAPRPTGQAAQGNPQEGMALYTKNCAACHGPNAEGGVGPALKGNKFIQGSSDDQITQTIANGRPGTAMPAWKGRLNDTQIGNLVAYMHALQK